MNRIVLTGGTSMIGIALLEECLRNNVEAVVLSRKNSPHLNRIPQSKKIHIVDCGLDDLKNFEGNSIGFDTFYHLAWSGSDKRGRMNIETQQKNIGYTLDAVDLAKRLSCKKFIGAGSQAEYGVHVKEKTGPDSPANPMTPYGICKYAAGKLAMIKAQELGMNTFWVRIFSVYGKYDSPDSMIMSTIRKLKNKEHCAFTPATQIWDYLHCDDAARALYAIGDKSKGSKIYCLGSGEGRPLKEFIREIQKAVDPMGSIGLGEILYQGGVAMNLCADITTLTKDTGWMPSVVFRDGLATI